MVAMFSSKENGKLATLLVKMENFETQMGPSGVFLLVRILVFFWDKVLPCNPGWSALTL